MKKIDVFIAGAQKAGTSSLKNYLAQHPEICTHPQVECMYFLADHIFTAGYDRAYKRYFGRCHAPRILLAKNVGVMTSTVALDRLYKHNPKMTLVAVLRNPVDRAYSAYWYARRMGWENISSFDEAVWADPARHSDPVAQRNCAYLERGLYVKHLREIYKRFPKENVLVFLFEDLKKNTVEVCQTVFQELGLPPFVPNTGTRHNPARKARWELVSRLAFQPTRLLWLRSLLRWLMPDLWRDNIREYLKRINQVDFRPPPMHPSAKARLVEFYRPYNMELAKLLGKDLSHWNKQAMRG